VEEFVKDPNPNPKPAPLNYMVEDYHITLQNTGPLQINTVQVSIP